MMATASMQRGASMQSSAARGVSAAPAVFGRKTGFQVAMQGFASLSLDTPARKQAQRALCISGARAFPEGSFYRRNPGTREEGG